MPARKPGHVRTFPGRHTSYRLIYHNGRQCLEHRVVMSQQLGRELRSDEVVHHIDENGLNNDPSNLMVMSPDDHRRMHGGPRLWDLAMALRLRAEGATIQALAEMFGVNESAINRVLKRRGHSTEAPPRVLKFDRDTALALYHQGISITKIARQLGVAPPSIRKALKQLGAL